MKLVCGVGFNDRTKPSFINGKNTKEYNCWTSMLSRCYLDKYKKRYPTYAECGVSENFKNYSYFYDWCHRQIGFNMPDYNLDKDIIKIGNKIYSEDFCAFIPTAINCLLVRPRNKFNDLPTGVYFCKRTRKYRAQCNDGVGRVVKLGNFNTPEQAESVYLEFKKEIIMSVAVKYKGLVDNRVYDSLIELSL